MTIRVDSSSSSHLAHCSGCPSFRALRPTSAAAWAAGAAHERSVHPGATQAQKSAHSAAQRA